MVMSYRSNSFSITKIIIIIITKIRLFGVDLKVSEGFLDYYFLGLIYSKDNVQKVEDLILPVTCN